MIDVAKNPAECSSARFGTERAGNAFALLSCAAWLDVELINHQGLGIRRGDTYVFPPNGKPEEQMIKEIGAKSFAMCANCERFSSKVPANPPAAELNEFSDPEYSPDPALWPVGVPRTDTARSLHDTGF